VFGAAAATCALTTGASCSCFRRAERNVTLTSIAFAKGHAIAFASTLVSAGPTSRRWSSADADAPF